MNYRHSFHAGNSADVVKHTLLIALVRALQQKEGALTLIDTHAGCGLYDLGSGDAQRTGESVQGVLRAVADPNSLLGDYRAAVQAVNVGVEPHLYPGSPRILASLLRPQDFLILNEKHPEDAYALRGAMRGTEAAVHERDGYEFWLAMLPTSATTGTARGLVVVDPPYEQPDERAQLAATLAAACRKWAHGVTMAWYPLKDRATHWHWEEQLRTLGIPKLLRVEHWLYDREQAGAYNGSGLYIVNPPYAFVQALPPLLGALRAALAPAGQRGELALEWLSA